MCKAAINIFFKTRWTLDTFLVGGKIHNKKRATWDRVYVYIYLYIEEMEKEGSDL